MDLEHRLFDDDPEAWSVYADHLLDAGDPRGPWVVGMPEVTGDREVPEAFREQGQEHGWYGPFVRPARHRLTWRRGFWHGFGNWSSSQQDAWWAELFGHPSARFLRDVAVRWVEPEVLYRSLDLQRPPIRRFHWNQWDDEADLDALFARLPHVRDLGLWRPGRFSGSFPALTALSVNTGPCPGLRDDLVAAAGRGELDGIEDLEVWGTPTEPVTWAIHVLERARPRRMALIGSIDGKVIPGLVASPAFATIRELDLQGFWPDDGALSVLLAALEARVEPLDRWTSTGREYDDGVSARLRGVARDVQARG